MEVGLFEISSSPAGLKGVTARLLHKLQAQVISWGLPSRRLDQVVRILHYRTSRGVIKVQTDTSSDEILLIVGRPGMGRLFEICGGHVSWALTVPAGMLEEACDALDREMAELGLFDPATGERRDVLSGTLSVERHFPQPGDCYYLGPDEDAAALIAKFDEPGLLTICENKSGRRILCRAIDAQAILSVSLSDEHFKNMPSA